MNVTSRYGSSSDIVFDHGRAETGGNSVAANVTLFDVGGRDLERVAPELPGGKAFP